MSRKRFDIKKILLAALMTALLLAAGFGVYGAGKLIEKTTFPQKYLYTVEKSAAENGLKPELVFAVIKTESNFRESIVSSAGAVGLMQIMPPSADALDNKHKRPSEGRDLLDPDTNIRYGCEMLRWMLDEFKNEKTAIAAYNGGWGNVKKWLSDKSYSTDGKTLHTIPFKETENFVRRVLLTKEKYKELYYNGGI